LGKILKNIKITFSDQKVVHSKDHKKIVKALKELKRVFEKHDILFWLEAGTLIGAVREGKIIPWDDDADITIWIKDGYKLIDARKDFENTEFDINIISVHIPTYGVGHFEIIDRKTRKHLICILFNYVTKGYMVRARFSPPMSNVIKYFFYSKNDTLFKLSWKILMKFHFYKDEKVRYPIECFGSPQKIKFYGEYFYIPEHYDECLTHMYGNWRVPDEKNEGMVNNRLKDLEK